MAEEKVAGAGEVKTYRAKRKQELSPEMKEKMYEEIKTLMNKQWRESDALKLKWKAVFENLATSFPEAREKLDALQREHPDFWFYWEAEMKRCEYEGNKLYFQHNQEQDDLLKKCNRKD